MKIFNSGLTEFIFDIMVIESNNVLCEWPCVDREVSRNCSLILLKCHHAQAHLVVL